MPNEARHSAYRRRNGSGGGGEGWGPFDPRTPLARTAVVESAAFAPTPQPASVDQQPGRRVPDLQVIIQQQQQEEEEEEQKPRRSPGQVDPGLQSRAQNLDAVLLTRRASTQ